MGRSKKVIRRAIDLGRGRMPFLLGLAAVIFIPLALLDTAQQITGGIETAELSDLQLLAAVVGAAVTAATTVLGGILYTGAVAIVVHMPAGRDPSLRRMIRQTRWLPLLAIDLLFAAGFLLGLVLLVIPGMIFFARYVLVAVLAEIEDLGVRASFRRSAELTRGARRLVFGLIFGAFLAGGALSTGIHAVLSDLGADGFLVHWIAALGSEVVINPVIALLSVALVLELGGRLVLAPGSAAEPELEVS